MQNPYIQTKRNGKKIDLHRALMQEHVGRSLGRNEYVHHVNEDKRDNRIDNLKIVSPSEHGLEHTRHPIEKSCVICGLTFRPHKTKRVRQQCCSDACRRQLLKQKNVTRKVSDDQVLIIRQRRGNGEKLRVLAAEFGVSETNISLIARGKSR